MKEKRKEKPLFGHEEKLDKQSKECYKTVVIVEPGEPEMRWKEAEPDLAQAQDLILAGEGGDMRINRLKLFGNIECAKLKRMARRGVSLCCALAMLALAPASAWAAEGNVPTFDGIVPPWSFLEDENETRKRVYSESELSSMVRNLQELRAELSAEGIQMALFIAPDKEEVYGEYLPPNRALATPDPLDAAVAYLQTSIPDMPIVYSKAALLAAKENLPAPVEYLYYEVDSHWNNVGGYIGARALAEALPVLHPAAEEDAGAEEGSAGTASQGGYFPEHQFYLLQPHELPAGISVNFFKGFGLNRLPSTEYEFAEPLQGRADEYIVSNENADFLRMRFHSVNPNCRKEKLYLVGDSYRFALARPLAEAFSELTAVNWYYLDLDDVVARHPDILVIELVGRLARQLLAIPGYNVAALPANNVRVVTAFNEDGTIEGDGLRRSVEAESGAEGQGAQPEEGSAESGTDAGTPPDDGSGSQEGTAETEETESQDAANASGDTGDAGNADAKPQDAERPIGPGAFLTASGA